MYKKNCHTKKFKKYISFLVLDLHSFKTKDVAVIIPGNGLGPTAH